MPETNIISHFGFRQSLCFPSKHRLWPQNGSKSSRLEKLPKIVNCVTIKETKKLKEIVLGVQVELEDGHQYPLGSVRLFLIYNLVQFLYVDINCIEFSR